MSPVTNGPCSRLQCSPCQQFCLVWDFKHTLCRPNTAGLICHYCCVHGTISALNRGSGHLWLLPSDDPVPAERMCIPTCCKSSRRGLPMTGLWGESIPCGMKRTFSGGTPYAATKLCHPNLHTRVVPAIYIYLCSINAHCALCSNLFVATFYTSYPCWQPTAGLLGLSRINPYDILYSSWNSCMATWQVDMSAAPTTGLRNRTVMPW